MSRVGRLAARIVTRPRPPAKTASPAARPPHSGPLPNSRTRTVVITWGTWIRLLLILAILAVLLPGNWQAPPSALDQDLERLTRGVRFNLFTWEVESIQGKLHDFVARPSAGLTPEQAKAQVVSYLGLAQRAATLEEEIERVYADPTQRQPDQATEGRRTELAAIRRQLNRKAPLVEAILEDQASHVLAQAGLTTFGVVWPPPRLRFTEPPQLLVISPRERIERLRSLDLIPDLDTAERDWLEQTIARQHNVSTYITGIGGYGAWPTMVIDRYGLTWTLETIAHEWVHNYLSFHPLGWAYLFGGDAVTLNETVADIVGQELGRMILETYYPEHVPPPPIHQEAPEPPSSPQPRPFEFGPEMRATRLAVDALLAKGYVEEAEAFMEARRQAFVAHGYSLRVLNQAYFAFHGSYATGPASTDPIGPKLQRLRELTPSLADFLHLVDDMTSAAELDAALARLQAQPSSVTPAGPSEAHQHL